MMPPRQFSRSPATIPMATSWYIADLSEALGKQQLFTRQSPQRLKALRQRALIESAISSNRIEGVEIDQKRVGTIIFGKPKLKDRDEQEVRGYRDALNLIHTKGAKFSVSEPTILQLHKMARGGGGQIWDAGQYKEKDGDIIEAYADGRSRVRFKTVRAKETPAAMQELVQLWHDCLKERWIHPFIALAAFNLDFLCIHPFRDGNGRASRLLLLLQSYHLGLEVGRYISLERLIEDHKERYYETLEYCSHGWHQGRHDPWPYINHLLFILKTAYAEFERRVGDLKSPRGEKTQLLLSAIEGFDDQFTMAQLERTCPGVSREMMRVVLRRLAAEGSVECMGRGPGAPWRRKGTISKRG
jgi:Fic family protein